MSASATSKRFRAWRRAARSSPRRHRPRRRTRARKVDRHVVERSVRDRPQEAAQGRSGSACARRHRYGEWSARPSNRAATGLRFARAASSPSAAATRSVIFSRASGASASWGAEREAIGKRCGSGPARFRSCRHDSTRLASRRSPAAGMTIVTRKARGRCPRVALRHRAGGRPRRQARGRGPSRAASASPPAARSARARARDRPPECRARDPRRTTRSHPSAAALRCEHRRAPPPSCGAPYLSALSTRFASAWPISSRLPCTMHEAIGVGRAPRSPPPRPAARRVRRRRARPRPASNGAMPRGSAPASSARDHQERVEDADEVVGSPRSSSRARRDNRPASRAVRKRLLGALRSRVSGVLRSWAMLSETSRRPAISSSMRSSIALRFSASRSSSSFGARDRQASVEIARHDASARVSFMASTRRSTRRATNKPPSSR